VVTAEFFCLDDRSKTALPDAKIRKLVPREPGLSESLAQRAGCTFVAAVVVSSQLQDMARTKEVPKSNNVFAIAVWVCAQMRDRLTFRASCVARLEQLIKWAVLINLKADT